MLQFSVRKLSTSFGCCTGHLTTQSMARFRDGSFSGSRRESCTQYTRMLLKLEKNVQDQIYCTSFILRRNYCYYSLAQRNRFEPCFYLVQKSNRVSWIEQKKPFRTSNREFNRLNHTQKCHQMRNTIRRLDLESAREKMP